MTLDDRETNLVLMMCDKVQLSGLQAMNEILMLAGKCQRALKPPMTVPASTKVEDADEPVGCCGGGS